jgi:peptidoglycan hydrolase-like protein with peptidoglycan-binding domain
MSNALLIYNQLCASGLTEAGALGLLGNWMAESGLEPNRLQGDFSQGRLQSKAYTDDVTANRISRQEFARDQKGYGLAQWTYFNFATGQGRKLELYDFWKNSGTALDDVRMQVRFALHELSTEGQYAGLWSLLKTTDDIWTAVDRVCRLYEQPYFNNVDARYQYALTIKEELDRIGPTPQAEEPEQEPAQAAEEASPAPAQKAESFWPPRTICNGMSGDDTAVLQALLKARGWPVHYVDGAFGAYLEDIVKDFQKSAFPNEPQEWDGIVGPKTWGKLLER